MFKSISIAIVILTTCLFNENLLLASETKLNNELSVNHDLYLEALRIYDIAKNGNARMQFELAYILLNCKLINTVRDMPNRYNDHHVAIDMQNWWLTRCMGFTNENIQFFGDSEGWFTKSAEGGYAPAVVLKLSEDNKFDRTTENLLKLHKALRTKNHHVMGIIGSASSSTEAIVAWQLLECDYGLDCSNTSKEIWRFSLTAYCTLEHAQGNPCDTDLTYLEYVQRKYPQDIYKEIMNKKLVLKNSIENRLISELTWKQLLD
ncbi:MAG: hypothetical protein GY928_40575 [Colwellia sp.]|nr:hypothetical protein [Colwellia sp.]